jgi:hypothetical protein
MPKRKFCSLSTTTFGSTRDQGLENKPAMLTYKLERVLLFSVLWGGDLGTREASLCVDAVGQTAYVPSTVVHVHALMSVACTFGQSPIEKKCLCQDAHLWTPGTPMTKLNCSTL